MEKKEKEKKERKIKKEEERVLHVMFFVASTLLPLPLPGWFNRFLPDQ